MAMHQMLIGVKDMVVPPAAIGDSYAGGYYAGQIAYPTGVYNLVISPKATGQASSISWSTGGVITGATSLYDGAANTLNLANQFAYTYPSADFCVALSIGGYTDWYLPSYYELEIMYYYLKPDATLNYTTIPTGINPYAVSPQPNNTAYTTTVPPQTNVSIFRTGGSEAFVAGSTFYWTSTESTNFYAAIKNFSGGSSGNLLKGTTANVYTRAIRRVPA